MKDQRYYRAFTLVELLIVIAIITILALLIFTSTNSSRSKGQETTCIGHLQQLHHALAMYRSDWDGQYPLDPRQANKPYINDTRVYYCPADRRPPATILPEPWLIEQGFLPGMNNPSYIYHPAGNTKQFVQAYERRGEATPIMVDRQHNSLSDWQSGKERRFIVLRADGSIHTIILKAKEYNSIDL